MTRSIRAVPPAASTDDVVRLELSRVDPQAAARFYGALGLAAAVRLEADLNDAAPLCLDCPGLELTIHRAADRTSEAPVILRFFTADLAATVAALCAFGGSVVKPREASPPPHRAVVYDGHGAYLVLTRHAPRDDRSFPVSFRSMTFDSDDRRHLHRSLWFVGIGAVLVAASCSLVILGIVCKSALDLGRFFRYVILPLFFVGVLSGLTSSFIGKVVRRPLCAWQSFPSLNAAAGLEVVAVAAWIFVPWLSSHEYPLAFAMVAGAAPALSAALYLRYLGRLASLTRSPAYHRAGRRCLTAWIWAVAVCASAAVVIFQDGVYRRTYFQFIVFGAGPFVVWIVDYVVVLWKVAGIGAERPSDDVAGQSDVSPAPPAE